MKHIDICEICYQKASGKRYDFYYGLFLGNTDVYIGGPGTVGNRWTEHYRILGQSGSFICEKCISREFWRRVFSEPRLPEMQLRLDIPEALFVGTIIGLGLLAGLAKVTKFMGLTGSNIAIFLLFFCVGFGWVAALMLDKIWGYSSDFGNEMAYRISSKELPRISNLICIPPSKYKLMNRPAASPQEKPGPISKIATQEQTPKIEQIANSSSNSICSKCGNVGLPKDRFCRKCGNPLR